MTRNIRVPDIIHRPVLISNTQGFGDWILSRLQAKPTQLGPIETVVPYI
jgi:hypothetical protein